MKPLPDQLATALGFTRNVSARHATSIDEIRSSFPESPPAPQVPLLIGTIMLFSDTTLASPNLWTEFGAIFLAIGVVFASFALLGTVALIIFFSRRRPKRRLGWQKA